MATRVFDTVLLTRPIILFVTTQSFEWSVGEDLGASGAAFTLVAGLLCMGIMGKIAQCPFNGCLPSVSDRQMPSAALLFSARPWPLAYMIVRAYPLFSASESVLSLMCWVGALTAAFSAALALMTNNFKTMLIFTNQFSDRICLSFSGYWRIGGRLHQPRWALCSPCISVLSSRTDVPLSEHLRLQRIGSCEEHIQGWRPHS